MSDEYVSDSGGNKLDDPRLIAAVDLIGRTGAKSFAIRYSDDEQPVVWSAVADYGDGRAEAAGALHPLVAVLRLAELLIDGGTCTHCGRPTGVHTDRVPESMPLDQFVCWYQFDPELSTFRRGCEGDKA
jgi:hypothetical protein